MVFNQADHEADKFMPERKRDAVEARAGNLYTDKT